MVIKQIGNWLDLVALLKKLNVRREEQVFSKSQTENDNWDERERGHLEERNYDIIQNYLLDNTSHYTFYSHSITLLFHQICHHQIKYDESQSNKERSLN